MLIGYARDSTQDQDTDAQIAALKSSGCELIFQEKASGGRWDRPELHRLLGAGFSFSPLYLRRHPTPKKTAKSKVKFGGHKIIGKLDSEMICEKSYGALRTFMQNNPYLSHLP